MRSDEIKQLKAEIQKLKQLNRELEEAQAYYEDILAHLPGHVYWLNKDNVYLGCNTLHATNVNLKSRKDIVGKTNYDMPWRDQAENLDELNNLIMRTGTPQSLEEAAIFNNELRTFLSQKVPLRNKDNEVIGILGISTDITELKRLQEDLRLAKEKAENASHAKSEFIANMSHDIRTPLSGIVGISKILEEEVQKPDEKKHARWINDSGEQLLSLLNSILDIVSAENLKESDLEQSSFDLRQTILEVCRLELPAIKLKNLDLNIDVDEKIPQTIISDRVKLHRVLLNFIGNAIKFTEKGRISLKVKQHTRTQDNVILEFIVSDTGIGIDDELQEKVFDRFFRINPSYKGVYQGHGIGLHIAKKYVNLLGGEITLKSKLGTGSRFSFTINVFIEEDAPPLQKPFDLEALETSFDIEEMVPVVAKEKHLNLESTKPLPRVLLVEDNIIALRLVETVAKQAGCEITSATDGEKALKLAHSNDFDLIITDIGLPGISGNELAEQIRATEKKSRKKTTPIVGLTAHALTGPGTEYVASGLDKVYAKPINLKTMQTILTTFVSTQDVSFLPESPLDTTTEHFKLEHYPLIDEEKGVSLLGSRSALQELLTAMLTDALPVDEGAIKKAYVQSNWDAVENLAHKMKSGAIYCGAVRMQHACQNLVHCCREGRKDEIEQLYQQLIQVVDETKKEIAAWLEGEK
ncbi:sensory box sensor histidine kinase/response regulator [Legionella lansingensis]|uniref:histidine kinase n=1 Tax=Legionella lansingensis TaxID=45067 RepID=A0A0W0VZH6_9GAMM|nr:ATP-binding protein [Legionella lansingensis]KTD25385.1 sensory box sensor histidine kinase/response regulator [Legionella lansingensis]SNV51321.1 sensory box sensor histidine kinase/response regulator [Legionella lansingensis]